MDLDLPVLPGTYALVMRSAVCAALQIGRLGILHLQPGVYVYVGSAYGPGGLRSRVGRHRRVVKALHWHIDYLRPAVQMEDIWFTCNPAVTEHAWAETFRSMPGAAIPLPGFGSSDCRCAAHLFFFSDTPGPPIKSLRFRPDSADGD